MAGVSSQGTTFSFAGTTFTVTSVQVDYGQERRFVGAGHMGLAPNEFEPIYRIHRTEDERPTVDIEFIGQTAPTPNTSGAFSIAGKLTFSGNATCVSARIGVAVGEIVRGSASFRVVPS